MGQAALVAEAASGIAGGIGAAQQASAAQSEANLNAEIARTRALQVDASSRAGMEQQLGMMRAAIASNSQQLDAGTLPLLENLRTQAEQERQIKVNNEMNMAAGYQSQAQADAAAGFTGFAKGVSAAGPSLFQLANGG